MTETLQTALILMMLLQLKHLFADFFLQTPAMLADRARYLHMGRLAHAGIHSFGSTIAFLILGAPMIPILALILVEWVVHFHIDWAKGWYSDLTGDSPVDPGYWRAFGADQFLHQATYLAMIWAWAVYVL